MAGDSEKGLSVRKDMLPKRNGTLTPGSELVVKASGAVLALQQETQEVLNHYLPTLQMQALETVEAAATINQQMVDLAAWLDGDTQNVAALSIAVSRLSDNKDPKKVAQYQQELLAAFERRSRGEGAPKGILSILARGKEARADADAMGDNPLTSRYLEVTRQIIDFSVRGREQIESLDKQISSVSARLGVTADSLGDSADTMSKASQVIPETEAKVEDGLKKVNKGAADLIAGVTNRDGIPEAAGQLKAGARAVKDVIAKNVDSNKQFGDALQMIPAGEAGMHTQASILDDLLATRTSLNAMVGLSNGLVLFLVGTQAELSARLKKMVFGTYAVEKLTELHQRQTDFRENADRTLQEAGIALKQLGMGGEPVDARRD